MCEFHILFGVKKMMEKIRTKRVRKKEAQIMERPVLSIVKTIVVAVKYVC
jgi:hypothetical protein